MAERPIRYVHISGPESLPATPAPAAHCAIIVSEESLTPDERFDVAVWLVRSGCTLMMAWGHDGSAWDDAGDWADLSENRYDLNPQRDFQMTTTWHDDEELNEVFNYSTCWESEDPALKINHTLVLHVASKGDQERIMGLLLAPLGD